MLNDREDVKKGAMKYSPCFVSMRALQGVEKPNLRAGVPGKLDFNILLHHQRSRGGGFHLASFRIYGQKYYVTVKCGAMPNQITNHLNKSPAPMKSYCRIINFFFKNTEFSCC